MTSDLEPGRRSLASAVFGVSPTCVFHGAAPLPETRGIGYYARPRFKGFVREAAESQS